MTLSTEELELIEQVLGYAETGSTQLEPDVMLNPVSNYNDPDQLQREVDVLFRQLPLIVGHSTQLSEAGQFITHNDTGAPLLITRNRGGEIKAFLNVCRHRGARVATEPCGKANTFSCPYHGWTYDLDGKLRGMRQPQGFPDIDKANHGLAELPAFERFGLIWVRPEPSDKPIDIDTWLDPMAEQLASLSLETHHVYSEWSLHRNMNWRIALEGFLETYHFCSAHKDTACGAYLDNQSPFLNKYPHIRNAVPLARIKKLAELPKERWDYRANFMTQNYLFPCNFIQVMTDHVYIHTIVPTGPSSCVFKCLMLIPTPPATAKAEQHWDANLKVVREVFNEDFLIGEGIQQGLTTTANQNFTFGRFEAGLQLAQKALDDALQGNLTAPEISG